MISLRTCNHKKYLDEGQDWLRQQSSPSLHIFSQFSGLSADICSLVARSGLFYLLLQKFLRMENAPLKGFLQVKFSQAPKWLTLAKLSPGDIFHSCLLQRPHTPSGAAILSSHVLSALIQNQ